MENPYTAFVVYTASALLVAMFADVTMTARRIFRLLEKHNERIIRLETRCQDTHGHAQQTTDYR